MTNRFLLKLPTIKLQPPLAWLAILSLILVTSLCLGVHLGRVLNLLFPAGAFATGTFLYLRYPLFYNSFTWWIWFLTPWVRRMIDLQAGYSEPSIVLTAPLLVTSLTFLTFLKYLPKESSKVGLAFKLCAMAVIYSFLIGMIKNAPTSAILNFLGWITPILFGFHLYVNWRSYPEYSQNTQRTFFWGTLVMGVYGVVQFLIAPEWDKYWLTNVQANGIFTFGNPEPLGIRVYSTMNAPQPFAAVIMAGLILLFCGNQGALMIPA
ncbi:MAG: O-antigen ligase domain-containing protein, partial [Kovacikia sp.]